MNNNGPLDTLSGKMSGSDISRDIYRQRLEILKGFFPKLGQYPTRGQRAEVRGQGSEGGVRPPLPPFDFRPPTSDLRFQPSAFSPPPPPPPCYEPVSDR